MSDERDHLVRFEIRDGTSGEMVVAEINHLTENMADSFAVLLADAGWTYEVHRKKDYVVASSFTGRSGLTPGGYCRE